MKKITIAVLVFTVFFQITNLHAKTWQKIESPEGKFVISMPGKPTYKKKDQHSPVGTICENTYKYKSGNITLTIEYQDLPGLALILGDGMVYSKSAKAFLKDVNGVKKSFKSFKYYDRTGKELYYETPTRFGWTRFLLISRRLYVLQASFIKGFDGSEVTKKYFNSFESSFEKPWRKMPPKHGWDY